MLPLVMHYRNNLKFPLQEGMVFTIEPMICEGSADCHTLAEDGWTVYHLLCLTLPFSYLSHLLSYRL